MEGEITIPVNWKTALGALAVVLALLVGGGVIRQWAAKGGVTIEDSSITNMRTDLAVCLAELAIYKEAVDKVVLK